MPVTYQQPIVTGAPAAASCTPASGSVFAVGTTSVACSTTATSQRASCSFNVTVSPPPRLDKTKILAFGDSITWGSGHFCPGGPVSERWTPAELLLPWADPVPPATSYPSVLQASLRDRYTAQLPVVINLGMPLEAANDSDTRRRFTRALNEHQPEVVLLQEGINDLHAFDFYDIPINQGISNLVAALRAMSLEARGRGIRVFLGTLLPQRPNFCRAYAIPPRGPQDMITPANNLIRGMAAAEGLDLIDLYAVVEPQLNTLIGQDGLHPTDAGYAAIAKAFFDVIRQKLEIQPTPTSTITRP